ncbi:hypothetical protein EDD16DRAFT_1707675 [Pisolithus croceorrhizus]|nr:hypothetical protein EV401DRAFT_1893356 [Pisolithus croceorrhizus]KAI6117341.1 hypothetical protein EDD16DRAFT_1707675 [Pisolithus croceorrhizus]KAI6161524.1 hypothetical protein EDD17DRAFT_1509260 [Pisolithus thermaeus]
MPPKPSFAPDLPQISSTWALLHSQKADPPQHPEFGHAGYGMAPSFGPLDDEKPEWVLNSCPSTASRACKQSTLICTGMVDDIRVRNNNHPPIHTPLDDRWITHYRASNHIRYPALAFSSPPVTDLSLHYTMRHSSEYPQDDGRVSMFGELPPVHRASAASATGLVSTLPYHGHASFQFDSQAKRYDGNSMSHQPFGQETESEVSLSATSDSVMPLSQKLHPSYSGGENILPSTNPSTCHSFRAETTTNMAVPQVFHDSAVEVTAGCVGDYGSMDLVSDQDIDSNLLSSSFSETAPSPREPCTSKRSLNTGEENLATLPGPLAANGLADDAIIHHDSTMVCGWIEPDGKTCDERIDYRCEGHFATAHGIQNMSWDVKAKCRWCPASAKKEVKRKSFIRHIREVHMKYQRPQKGESGTPRRRN